MIELIIKTALFEELVMGTGFLDGALVEDEDILNIFDGGEAMSDDNGGGFFQGILDIILDEGFGMGVDMGGGFVEDNDFGIMGESASKGDELFLAGGEADTEFSQLGIILIFEFDNKRMGLGFDGGLDNFLIGDGRIEETNIVFD